MTRLLALTVAVEMVLGGLAVVALSGDSLAAPSTAGRPTRSELTGGRAAAHDGAPEEDSRSARRCRRSAKAAGAAHAEPVARARPSTALTPDEEARGSAKEISFEMPVDFATGAVPSSAAFNAASGDQIHLVLARAPLSDSVAVGDFNRDRKPDVAQTNVVAGTLSVFLGNGRGGFAAPRQHPAGANPTFVVDGDLDGDGDLDLAIANFGSDSVSILRGNGEGTFEPAPPVPVPAPRNISIGNFNGDDHPDLAVTSSAPGRGTLFTNNEPTRGAVMILTGNGIGGFTPNQVIATTAEDQPVNANAVAAGDFDGDGRDDLAVGVGISSNAGDRKDGDNRLTGDDALIFLNRHEPLGTAPEQPFSAGPEQRIRVGAWPAAIVVADLDRDTEPDLGVLDAASGDVTTLLGDGKGGFTVKATNVTVGAIPRDLAAADFNDDGILDLVTASFMASTASVLEGNGDGTFQPAVDFWAGDAPTSVGVGDFDGDGRPDVFVGRLRNDHLALLRNDSPQRGDGVVIARDIPYGSPTNRADELVAAHLTLDVYSPRKGTPSFAGERQPYPVVFFAHGGGGISGDKSMVSYLMRSLAADGIVAVSTNYRLGSGLAAKQAEDVAQAFRWTRDNIGSRDFGGDPENIFVFGYSAGAAAAASLATEETYRDERRSIRAFILAGSGRRDPGTASDQPPSLLLNGTEGVELILIHNSVAFSAQSRRLGADSRHVIIPGRDHLTIVSDIARADDAGRVAVVDFLRRHLLANP